MQTRDGLYIKILVHHVLPGDTVQPKNDAFTKFCKTDWMICSYYIFVWTWYIYLTKRVILYHSNHVKDPIESI